jgi:hypothetical protein
MIPNDDTERAYRRTYLSRYAWKHFHLDTDPFNRDTLAQQIGSIDCGLENFSKIDGTSDAPFTTTSSVNDGNIALRKRGIIAHAL